MKELFVMAVRDLSVVSVIGVSAVGTSISVLPASLRASTPNTA